MLHFFAEVCLAFSKYLLLDIFTAIPFAFSEYRNRPILWIFTGIISVLLENILTAKLGQVHSIIFWISFSSLFIVALYLQIGMINTALLAADQKEYDLADLMVKLGVFQRCCLIVVLGAIFWALCYYMLIPSTPPSAIFLQSSKILLIPLIIGITSLSNMLVIIAGISIVSLFGILFFSLFYILDRNMGVIESIVHSWKEGGIKAAISMIFTFFAVSMPLFYFESESYILHLITFFVPFYCLTWSHFYIQIRLHNQLLLDNAQWSSEEYHREEKRPATMLGKDNKKIASPVVEPVDQYYEKLGGMWDTLSCSCGWQTNLSPTCSEPSITCKKCKSKMYIKWG